MEVILAAIVIISSFLVYFDARYIGAERGLVPGIFDLPPWGWALACLVVWIIAFPAYLIKRPEIIDAVKGNEGVRGDCATIDNKSGINMVAQRVAVGCCVLCLVGLIAGIVTTGQTIPIPGKKYTEAGKMPGVALNSAAWITLFGGIAISSAVLFLVTRNNGSIAGIKRYQNEAGGKGLKCQNYTEATRGNAKFCRHCLREMAKPNTVKPILISSTKKDPSMQQFSAGSFWMSKGISLLSKEDYTEAVIALTKAIAFDQTGQAYFARAPGLVQAGIPGKVPH